MADMTARLALEDRQFARGMDRAAAKSLDTSRRMGGAFGLFTTKLLGGVAAYTSLNRVAGAFARAAERGRAANSDLAREFDRMGRASRKAFSEMESDAAEAMNTLRDMASWFSVNVRVPVTDFIADVIGGTFGEAGAQRKARQKQREQDRIAREQEEDRREAVEVEEEVARSRGHKEQADRIGERERHARRLQEINEKFGRDDAERARRLIDLEQKRHSEAMLGIDREEREKMKPEGSHDSAEIGLGRPTRGSRRGPGQTGMDARPSNRDALRRFQEFKEEQRKANGTLSKIERNTRSGAAYA